MEVGWAEDVLWRSKIPSSRPYTRVFGESGPRAGKLL
eukprot:COSAG06_NODE_1751_length_8472_cov_19.492774_8_plen_37_part_00